MPAMFRPGYRIDFEDKTMLTTTEVLEELRISYDTLAQRIKNCSFPRPVISGHNGKEARYDRGEVEEWLVMKKFDVKLVSKP